MSISETGHTTGVEFVKRHRRKKRRVKRLLLEHLETRVYLAADLGDIPRVVSYDLDTGETTVESEAEAAGRLAASADRAHGTDGYAGDVALIRESQELAEFIASQDEGDVEVDDWEAPVNTFDVNEDGNESPADILRIINHLNRSDDAAASVEASDLISYDVSQDGVVSALDVLQMVNRQNSGLANHVVEAEDTDPKVDGSVFGTDNRVRINATTTYPNTTKGFLRFQLSQDGSVSK